MEEEWTSLCYVFAATRLGLWENQDCFDKKVEEINEILGRKRKHFLAYQLNATSVSKNDSLLPAVVEGLQ